MGGYELESWDGNGTFGAISGTRRHARDVATLARLGKQQQLKRRFGFLALCGFACTILITWESVLVLFQQVFENGGPAGLAWGFPISWLCSTSVYMVLAEMASMAPIAGGQYFWVALLAPRRARRFLSYVTGWLTVIAWIATLAVGMIFVGTLLQGIAILNHPSWSAQHWQGTLLSWAVLAVAVVVNTVVAGLLPFLEGIILFLHILGFVAIMISLLYLSDSHGSVADVFVTSLNEGKWPTQGLSNLVGYMGNVATFVGADAAVHMSEEIENAPVNVPRAMFLTLILNGAAGYGMALAMLFSLGDIQSVMQTPTGFPFIQAFSNATGPASATIMATIVAVLTWCAVIGFLATASRMVWSFARDRALPWHTTLARVSAWSAVPVPAVLVVTTIPCLLALIYIGSPTAHADVVSMSVSGLYASYLIPAACLLWRRFAGHIHAYQPSSFADCVPTNNNDDDDDDDEDINKLLMWGPWRIPGIWGTLNNAFACAYCVFVLFWDFWPPQHAPGPATMNYAVLVFGAAVVFSLVYWVLWGRTEYLGPRGHRRGVRRERYWAGRKSSNWR